MSELQAAAMAYALAGRRVHPCRPDDKRPYTRWSEAATTRPLYAHWLWRQWPDSLIGLCTGGGLVVVDVDPRNGGELDEDNLATLTARTRSGGWHHYYYTHEYVGNAVGLLQGVDVRGEGGYVIAPPSPGWEWENDVPMLELPRAVIDAMAGARGGVGNQASFEARDRVAEGGRNDYIARYTGYAIRMGLEDLPELLGQVLSHNEQVCVPPLDDAEVGRTVRSIHTRHERNA